MRRAASGCAEIETEAAMDREKGVAFVEGYGRTWQAWDFEGFADLFSDEAVYVEHPPMRQSSAAPRSSTTFSGSKSLRVSQACGWACRSSRATASSASSGRG